MTIDNLWSVFVSGPMQIIKGVNFTFSNQFSDINSISHNFFYSLIVYACFTAIGIMVSLITLLINRLSIKKNTSFNSLSTKNLFFCLLIIVVFPLILFLISLFFNYVSPLILSAVSKLEFNQIGDQFFKSLYNIGNNTNIMLNFPTNNSFAPPVNLQNWNIYVQIGVTNVIMWTMIYLLWNYAQKIIEIFILSITLPASSFFKNENKQLGILLWLKEIWYKLISCICSITCFYFYTFSIQIIINAISKVEYLSKFVLSFFVTIALLGATIITTNVFNQRNRQYRGIIKSIFSLRDAVVFNFKTIQQQLSKKSIVQKQENNIEFQNRINGLKNSAKPATAIDNNNEVSSLKNTTIY